MKYQAREWSCGPASLLNACRALGIKVSEAKIRSIAGTTEEFGTDEVQLISAARTIGRTATAHHSADFAASWAFVRSNLLEGKVCLLCIDNWGHWVTVIGISGDRVIIADPANTKKNVVENGIHSLSKKDLLRRWKCKNEQEPFYAITVGK